jgi:hypothetical protein
VNSTWLRAELLFACFIKALHVGLQGAFVTDYILTVSALYRFDYKKFAIRTYQILVDLIITQYRSELTACSSRAKASVA